MRSTPDACRVCLFIAVILAAISIAARAEYDPSSRLHDEIRDVKGRLLVQPRAGLPLRELDGILQGHGARRVEAIAQIDVHIVELPEQASEQAVAAVVEALRRHPRLRSAEPDRRLPRALAPNDPGYANAWHVPKIDSPRAWDYSIGRGITIAILDSGVDASHPDLVENLVAGYNFYDNNTNTADVHGHGTRVAGAAAMAGNNFIG